MSPVESLPVLEGLIRIAYALAALSLLSWLVTYFRRRAHIRAQAREHAAEAELTELILAQTEQQHPDGAPFRNLPRWRQRVLLRVLTGLLEQIQGAGRDRLISLTRAMGVRQFLEHALRHGRISDRINAAIILGEFADDLAASALTSALHDRNIGVRLTAARALLSHRCMNLTLRSFLEAIRFSDEDPSIALADIFERLPPHWHAEAIAMLRQGMPVNWRRMLVIALGRARVPGAFEAISALLREDDPRLRAAAWIGLAELGDPAVHAMMPQGMTDPSTDVRITTCHCAKRLQAISCIPALTRLLQADADWWVRYRAAQALAGMGAEGRSALLGAATGSSAQAADMGLLVCANTKRKGPMPPDWFTQSILTIAQFSSFGVLFLALVQNGLYVVQMALAFLELRRTQALEHQFSARWLLGTRPVPGISILVPAYNEEVTIIDNIRSLLTLRYPCFQIIVVNDGSRDGTAAQVITAFQLTRVETSRPMVAPHQPVRGIYRNRDYPDLLFIDKENGGKSDALNAALTFAEHPLVCAVDADSLLDHNSLLLAARPFLEEPDAMIAVGGTIRIANGSTIQGGTVVAEGAPRRVLPLFQVIEYFRAFLLARLAFSRLDAVAIVSGAFGLFKRSAVVQVGGYSTHTVGEDMELIVRLHRFFRDNGRRYSIRFLPDPVCWTEAPDTVEVLRLQRTRWQRGLCETLWTHRRMMFNARYGRIGLLSLPQFLMFDVVAPVLETVGLVLIPMFYVLGLIQVEFLLAYFAVVVLFGIFCSMTSFALAEVSFFKTTRRRDMVLYGLAAIGENFGYRQLNALWRIEGIWQFLRGRQAWGVMTRKGFAKKAAAPEVKSVPVTVAAETG